MPIYEYECIRCKREVELIQGFSDKPRMKCESCGGRLRKLVSQSAFHLKGSGWYVTDYASKRPGSKPSEKSDSTPDSKTDSKADAKSDTKPSDSSAKSDA